ncbi:response regulator [bacterium]|nr:response regulator [bacterium]
MGNVESEKAKIMVVEDESITALEIENLLEQVGYEMTGHAVSYDEAMKLVTRTVPDLILMDIKLHGEYDGIKTAEDIHKQYDIPIIYMTAYSDYQTLFRARNTNPYNYIAKPFNDDDLHASIMLALTNHAMYRHVRDHEYWLSSIINSMDDAIIAVDQDSRIRYMNTHAEVLSGFSENQVQGTPFDQVIRFIDSNSKYQVNDICSKFMKSEMPASNCRNVCLVTEKRPKIPVVLRGNPIIDEKGALLGCLLMMLMEGKGE